MLPTNWPWLLLKVVTSVGQRHPGHTQWSAMELLTKNIAMALQVNVHTSQAYSKTESMNDLHIPVFVTLQRYLKCHTYSNLCHSAKIFTMPYIHVEQVYDTMWQANSSSYLLHDPPSLSATTTSWFCKEAIKTKISRWATRSCITT